ncbi:hypothetical protein K435DRAFT_790550 [Dendrothele bispora CBS 962.96]|uniref:Uncharacterized protein n=1 Tax=Dendrothele bispora (strain CBS 962.96) TaxID=1314807 RepID=A0A4V4HI46_DENBC|nr:hypothetical protein K435DRAFT_790550 [Dendrothele bispora CBS 962.96]
MPLWSRTESLKPPGRDPNRRKTHLPGLVDMLANLRLDKKIERNHKIEQENEVRRDNNLTKKTEAIRRARIEWENRPVDSGEETRVPFDPETVICDDLSSLASLLTIDSQDYEKIRKSRPWREKLSEFLGIRFDLWAAGKDKDDEERERQTDLKAMRMVSNQTEGGSATGPSASTIQHSSKTFKTAPTFEPVARKIGMKREVIFIPQLFETANYNIHIPLAFFTNDNLRRLAMEGAYTSTRTIPNPSGTGGEIFILGVAKLCQSWGVPDSSHPTEGLDDYVIFLEAAQNYYDFECKRDPGGVEGQLYVEFAQKHFNFWRNQPDTHKLYKFWKPLELQLRMERATYHYLYDEAKYLRMWTKAETQAMIAGMMSDSSQRRSSSSVSASAGPQRSTPSFKGKRNEPYLERGKPPVCVGCTERGHKLSEHAEGKALKWSSAEKKGTTLWDKRDQKRICIIWNLYVPGSSRRCRGSCGNKHICSFCGDRGHGAFEWRCTQNPNTAA